MYTASLTPAEIQESLVQLRLDFAACVQTVIPPGTHPDIGFSAEMLVEIFDSMPSISTEAELQRCGEHFHEVNERIQNSGQPANLILLDYAYALRLHATLQIHEQKNPDPADYKLSRDLFALAVRRFAATPEDLQPFSIATMQRYFSAFIDVANTHTLNAWMKYVALSLIERSPHIQVLLKGDGRLSPQMVGGLMQQIHDLFCESFSVQPAQVYFAPDTLRPDRHGCTLSHIVDMDAEEMDHDIKIHVNSLAPCTMIERIGTLFHESVHLIQKRAMAAIYNIEVAATRLVEEQGVDNDAALDVLRNACPPEPVGFHNLIAKILHDPMVMDYAYYMWLAGDFYPENAEAQIAAYVANPMELQAFEMDELVEQYLKASPAERQVLREATLQVNHNDVRLKALREGLQQRLQAQSDEENVIVLNQSEHPTSKPA